MVTYMFNEREENELRKYAPAGAEQAGTNNDHRRLIKRICARLAIALTAIILAGGTYQFLATKIDERKYPAPGKMVDVGGHRLHLHCMGEGERTVILEAGLGGGVLDWSLVQPEIARSTRVCSYDRGGAGWSEASSEPRNAEQIVRELHILLERAELEPPFILVGHSIGGVYVQLYSRRYPDQVAAMVLVDSSHEDQFLRKELPKPSPVYPVLMKALAPLGVGRIIFQLKETSENVSPDVAAAMASVYSRTGHLYSVADELGSVPESLGQLRNSMTEPNGKPLIVLSQGLPREDREAEKAWAELQAELARRSTNGQQIIARNSGHYIQFAEPRLVISSIRQLIRTGSSVDFAVPHP
jgi:pimeloyl-ACP methyl ester carboxylesterase